MRSRVTHGLPQCSSVPSYARWVVPTSRVGSRSDAECPISVAKVHGLDTQGGVRDSFVRPKGAPVCQSVLYATVR
jgi:hypothetical protein